MVANSSLCSRDDLVHFRLAELLFLWIERNEGTKRTPTTDHRQLPPPTPTNYQQPTPTTNTNQQPATSNYKLVSKLT